MSAPISNVRPKPDQVLVDIVDYVTKYNIKGDLAYETARNCLIDTLACGFGALSYPACNMPPGPIALIRIPGRRLSSIQRVPTLAPAAFTVRVIESGREGLEEIV